MNCEIMVAWNMEFQVSVLAEFQATTDFVFGVAG